MPERSYGSTSGDAERGASSYDDDNDGEYIPADVYRASMRLVRLQMSIPLSVLIALGTLLVCGFLINPSIGEISIIHPTLLTPKPEMVVAFAVVLFILQIGFCLLLAAASSDWTKDSLINGVGLRLAVANWLTAAWAVTWTLSLFRTAAIIVIVEAIIVLSIHFTLQSYPASFAHPLNAVFIHTTINMMLALTLGLGWMSCGFVAQDYVIERRKDAAVWKWQAIGVVAGTHAVVSLWELFTRQYVLAICMEYQILTLLLATPHVYPPLPNNPIVRPPAFVITITALLAIHPLACVAGWAFKRCRESEVRIALQEEAEEADVRARRAEARAPPAAAAASPEASAAAEAGGAPAPPAPKQKKTNVNPEEEPLLET